MPTTYEPCPQSVADFAARVLNEFHPELAQASVTIDYAFAVNEDEDEHAMKIRGQRVLARVKLYNLEDRARGRDDAKICIDKVWWDGAEESERKAVMDHEHEHLQFSKVWRDEDGALCWKTDDLGRPKLKLKNHDAEAGIFMNVIQRHGDASADLANIKRIGNAIRKVIQRQFWG